jgi:hypothetical protein
MCSLRSSDDLFGPDGEEALQSAVADVAERSFFVMADPCDEAQFDGLAATHQAWLAATVRFDEGICAGSVTCTLPALLAERLFDAFSGRDPEEPVPDPDQLADLAGELANMICGAWLTRAANDKTFILLRPEVKTWSGGWTPAEAATRRLTLAIDDLPFAIDVRVVQIRSQLATAQAQS